MDMGSKLRAIGLMLAMCGGAFGQTPEVLSKFSITDDATFEAPAWGAVQKDQERSFRAYPGEDAGANLLARPWWPAGGAADADVVLLISYKDAVAGPVLVYSYNGYGQGNGYHFAGLIGGRGDGQWKQGAVLVSRDLIGLRNGRYSIQLLGEGALPIEQIEVVKPTEALRQKAIDEARALRSAEVARLKKTMEEEPWKEAAELGEVSQQQMRMGFVPFVRRYTQDVFPGTIPTVRERSGLDLKAYAALGEFEPMQAAACALADVRIDAAITDLSGPGTMKAGRDVVIHRIEATPVRVGASASKKWQVKPTWLRGNQTVEIKKGTSQAWYITVHVPVDATPGDYTGVFTLKTAAGKADFPIQFRVLPFALDKADQVARGAYCPGPVTQEHVERLAEHGVNSMSMWKGALPPKLIDGKCVAAVTAVGDAYLKSLKKHGFARMVYFGGGDNNFENPAAVASVTKTKVGTPEFETYYAQYWNDIRRLEKERSWPEMICCPFDEPVKTEEKISNYLTCYNIIKKYVPDTQVFCVMMNRDWAAKRMGKDSDIWSCNGAFAQAADEKKALAAQGVHRQFYTYCGVTVSARPGTVRFNSGFLPWRYDADGVYFWAYSWQERDPFNDLDGEFTDWTPAARDVDGVLYDTVAFEGWRAGVDDRRYGETAIRLAKEKKREDVLVKIEQLRMQVEAGMESDVSTRTQGLDSFFFEIGSASALEVYRARLAQMILEMLGAK